MAILAHKQLLIQNLSNIIIYFFSIALVFFVIAIIYNIYSNKFSKEKQLANTCSPNKTEEENENSVAEVYLKSQDHIDKRKDKSKSLVYKYDHDLSLANEFLTKANTDINKNLFSKNEKNVSNISKPKPYSIKENFKMGIKVEYHNYVSIPHSNNDDDIFEYSSQKNFQENKKNDFYSSKNNENNEKKPIKKGILKKNSNNVTFQSNQNNGIILNGELKKVASHDDISPEKYSFYLSKLGLIQNNKSIAYAKLETNEEAIKFVKKINSFKLEPTTSCDGMHLQSLTPSEKLDSSYFFSNSFSTMENSQINESRQIINDSSILYINGNSSEFTSSDESVKLL